MSRFRRSPKEDGRLLGKWKIDPDDAAAKAAFGDVAIEFDDAGNLIYIIKAEDKDQVILMTYRVDGTTIITDQPSDPRPERTAYAISDGVLSLSLGGVAARFIRA